MNPVISYVLQTLDHYSDGGETVTQNEIVPLEYGSSSKHKETGVAVLKALHTLDDNVMLSAEEISEISQDKFGLKTLKTLAAKAPLFKTHKLFSKESSSLFQTKRTKAMSFVRYVRDRGIQIECYSNNYDRQINKIIDLDTEENRELIDKLCEDIGKPFKIELYYNDVKNFLDNLKKPEYRSIIVRALEPPTSTTRIYTALHLLKKNGEEKALEYLAIKPCMTQFADSGINYLPHYMMMDVGFQNADNIIPYIKEKYESIFELPREEREAFGEMMSKGYPNIFDNIIVEPIDWLKLYEYKEDLASEPLQKYVSAFMVEFDAEPALMLYILLGCLYNDALTVDDDNLENATLVLPSLRDYEIPNNNQLLSVFIGLLSFTKELSFAFSTLAKSGFVTSDSLDELFSSFYDIARSPAVLEALSTQEIYSRLEQAKDLDVQGSLVEKLLCLAAWPEGVLIQDVWDELILLPSENKPTAFILLQIAFSPDVRLFLKEPESLIWLQRVMNLEDYPFYYKDLFLLTRIFNSGPDAREEIFSANYYQQQREFCERVGYGDEINSPTFFDPAVAYVLLTKPIDNQWDEFDKFVENNSSGPATLELYKMFYLIQTNDDVKTLYEQISRRPQFGEETVYDGEPLIRSDSNHSWIGERPEWQELPPVIRLRALLLKNALLDNVFALEIANNLVADIHDKTNEEGGSIQLSDQGSFSWEASLADGLPLTDGSFVPRDPYYFIDGVFEFHQHALDWDNSSAAGPSMGISSEGIQGDIGVAVRKMLTEVVFTTAGVHEKEGEQVLRFNADLYGANTLSARGDLVIDLGVFEVPLSQLDL
jgi:hypothetical protein